MFASAAGAISVHKKANRSKKHVIVFVTLSVFDCFKSVKIMVFK